MATKNLARTVVEGGRTGHSKFERQCFMRQERRATRNFLRLVRQDQLYFEERPVPIRQRAYKSFADKLSPAYRWLDSRVGKEWDQSHSALFRKFDTRTIAGRHIVFSHMLSSVNSASDDHAFFRYSQPKYIVDSNGVLTHGRRHRHEVYERDLKSYEPHISEWRKNRHIIQHGKYFFWLVPVVQNGSIGGSWVLARFRQEKKFSAEEKSYFQSLSEKAQKELLKLGLEAIGKGQWLKIAGEIRSNTAPSFGNKESSDNVRTRKEVMAMGW